jgi:hypothetical protein
MKEKELRNLIKWFEEQNIMLLDSEHSRLNHLEFIDEEWIVDNLEEGNIKGVKHEVK